MDRTIINSFKEIELKVYGYTLPEVPNHDGYVKIGDTTRDAVGRVFEQVGTAGLNPEILFEKIARKSDGQWFRDKELHRFLVLNGIEKKDFNGKADEWFNFRENVNRAEELTDKFINKDYDEVQISNDHIDYMLRNEQLNAVERTYNYYLSTQEPKEFLWNAKPRFGKTLTTYDYIRKISAQNILIVTNRPAIANSWFDDFHKFIAWQEPYMKFVSETDALKDKAMSRSQFFEYVEANIERNISQVAFLSLQDLKGAKFAGGNYDKLEWVRDLKWDLLVVDEAHEGVDTEKTDVAFDNIKRDFTLHLSGTPFKAIANNKFSEKQIFNWSYTDEQEAKKNWDESFGSNPYENLPTLNLFTYQMSKMVEDELTKGVTLEDNQNVDYAFDLNEFFKVKENGTFEYEGSVNRFLNNLSSGKFPFASDKYRDELKHTFWLLPRVNSAKAMEKLLRNHPIFKDYRVVLAAGDGATLHDDIEEEALDFKENEKSFNKVRNAIRDNERTITLSVGQLTTGVTIPEWTAVLMLNNVKSPSLYFQAAFRAQNPYQYGEDGNLFRKENAYIFDFSPERTLLLYDELANNLSGDGKRDFEHRKKKIRELLNFFPVIAEDEQGQMHEIDVEEVLNIPTRITSTEVVKRGFMSNLLFANISGIFSGDSPFKEILDKIKPEKNKRLGDRRDVNVTKPMLNDDGEVKIPSEIVINESKDLFGEKIYKVLDESIVISDSISRRPEAVSLVAEKITSAFDSGLEKMNEKYHIKKTYAQDVRNEIKNSVEEAVEDNIRVYLKEVNQIEEAFKHDYEEAKKENNPSTLAEIKEKYQVKKVETEVAVKEKIADDVKIIMESVVEEQIEKVEEKKKKTTEDDVRDHLRGFARTIPAFLMAYGDDSTKLASFETNIDEDTFLDLTSITLDEFKKLRDGFVYVLEDGTTKRVPGLFNEVVFNASIQEFFRTKKRLANYFDESLKEDIFDYIPPQKTNQIFTPRSVVKMMVDLIAISNPGIFSNYNVKFIDLYTKSGLYITEIVKRLNEGLKELIPNFNERIRWILENQVYVCAPSNIIYNISKNYIFADFKDISNSNIVEYDLTEYAKNNTAHIKLLDLLGDESLKFDVIISNPPYQEMDGGASASARPIYNHFIRLAKELNPKLISFIMPTRWYVGGKGLDEFRDDMLNDIHLRELHDWLTPEDIFPNTNIRGGVCYFLWDKNYDNRYNLTRVVTHEKNMITNDTFREMKIKGIDIFVRDGKAITILEKVFTNGNIDTMMNHISSRKPFGLEGNFIKDIKFRKNKSGLTDPILCYGKGQKVGYVERNEVTVRSQWIDIWKVYTPRANNIGTELNDDNLNTFVGGPKTICTESYLVVGAELRLDEISCKNLSKYLTTKFARYLHGIAKGSQDATSKTFKFVPIQNFFNDSDIDWSASFHEVDNQLYEKYGLSNEEINHIEIRIKTM